MFEPGDVMKVLTEQLTMICSPFGTVLSVIILHGRGQALVEMNSESAVDNFLGWSCNNLEGIDGSDQLKFHNWPQCASAQRGKRRSTNAVETKPSIFNPSDANDENRRNDEDILEGSRRNSGNIPGTPSYSRNRSFMLSDEIISKETSRCLTAMIKKIVCKDSEERMLARRMRKKNHEVLLLEMHEQRYKKELKDISTSSQNSIKFSEKRETSIIDVCFEKDEHFYNNWRENKYCLNKEELKLICWRFVASGGNIEFCPNFKPNSAEISKPGTSRNESLITNENSEKKTKIEDDKQHGQISPISGKMCPLFHISRPVTECPTNLRALEIEDFFPFSR